MGARPRRPLCLWMLDSSHHNVTASATLLLSSRHLSPPWPRVVPLNCTQLWLGTLASAGWVSPPHNVCCVCTCGCEWWHTFPAVRVQTVSLGSFNFHSCTPTPIHTHHTPPTPCQPNHPPIAMLTGLVETRWACSVFNHAPTQSRCNSGWEGVMNRAGHMLYISRNKAPTRRHPAQRPPVQSPSFN